MASLSMKVNTMQRATEKATSESPSLTRKMSKRIALVSGILFFVCLSTATSTTTTPSSSSPSSLQRRHNNNNNKNKRTPRSICQTFQRGSVLCLKKHELDLSTIRGGEASSSSSSSPSVGNGEEEEEAPTTDGLSTTTASTDLTTENEEDGEDVVDINEEPEEDKEEAVVEGDIDDNEEVDEMIIEVLEMEEATAKATELRLEGKKYHDDGEFEKAADLFRVAADTILKSFKSKTSKIGINDDDNNNSQEGNEDSEEDSEDPEPLPEDYATCRLHQALCYLKSDDFESCIEACSDVLQGEDSEDKEGDKASLMLGSSSLAGGGVRDGPFSFSPAVRARAYHRRAKAKSSLGDITGAVLDARTGAFLGYDKAVALYGKLMRQTSSQDISSAINPIFPSTDTTMLQSLFPNNSPSDSSSSPFGGGDMSPLSMLMGGNNGGGAAASMLSALTSGAADGNGGGGGLAGSMLRNLSKRIDDEDTQETICNFLQQTNKEQLGNLVAMTPIGSSVDDTQLDRIVNFCHGVTPRGIRRTVKFTKVTAYVVKFFRRLMKLINKYKSVFAVLLILQWTKSSVFRPVPLSPTAKKAAKKATKQALNDALKKSR